MLLSSEQEALLNWLQQQNTPVSVTQMRAVSAPGFTDQRIEELRCSGLITRHIEVTSQGRTFGTYTISDQGRASLLELQQKRHEQAENKREHRVQKQLSIAQVLVPLVVFVLGLVVEHYAGLVSALSEFFRQWIK